MYRRLTILSVIIVAAMLGMVWLGYHSITIWEKGLHGARLGEFAQAAEQIRRDVTRKLTEFMTQERLRPYTDYQYYYVPENIAPNQQMTVLTSPLRFSLSNGLAYGYFQISPEGGISTPYSKDGDGNYRVGDEQVAMAREAIEYQDMLREKLLPLVKISSRKLSVPAAAKAQPAETKKPAIDPPDAVSFDKAANVTAGKLTPKTQELKVESLLPETDNTSQVYTQNRASVEFNIYNNDPQRGQPGPATSQRQADVPQQVARQTISPQPVPQSPVAQISQSDAATSAQAPDDLVNVTVESFVPVVVDDGDSGPIFPGQIYLLRHVKIEDRDIVQGFRFDEKKLLEEVYDSASLIPSDMAFEIQPGPQSEAAYTAVLSFGRGELVFGLRDKDPSRVAGQIASLRHWYFGIVAVVLAAVGLGLASVWRNVHAQAVLAAKKDDFISAVSHELRTPLTSIRMHSEMLERNWVKSQDKLGEYYRSMRQESERLSRLIENVLDFSRIQRGRKKYNFVVGDLNKCIGDVIEMMKPYAAQNGFAIQADLGDIASVMFDRDAVTQVVVNLLDNSIKYSRQADDKTIYVRTRPQGRHTLIEVEDRGPGLPHHERKKVFEQFYRVAAESTREVPGTGLGLALVKRFVEAHQGFVEVLAAQPTGALFRVSLPTAG
jgi:signal transduction histidine kinase